jgi:hypothetical protein
MRQRELRGQEGKEEEAARGARGHRVDTTGPLRRSGGAGEAPASERSLPFPLEFWMDNAHFARLEKWGIIAGPS